MFCTTLENLADMIKELGSTFETTASKIIVTSPDGVLTIWEWHSAYQAVCLLPAVGV